MTEDKIKTNLNDEQLNEANGGAQHHTVPVYSTVSIPVCTHCGTAGNPQKDTCPNCGKPYPPVKPL
ncbi:hypothetical protein LJC56_06775 [Christensenellaceae bacterium OttesenSCG-928-K19]|nr:hypothetical protein [Christensenellaceae bacterium OttesenSCG-928-K19]